MILYVRRVASFHSLADKKKMFVECLIMFSFQFLISLSFDDFLFFSVCFLIFSLKSRSLIDKKTWLTSNSYPNRILLWPVISDVMIMMKEIFNIFHLKLLAIDILIERLKLFISFFPMLDNIRTEKNSELNLHPAQLR